MNNFITCGKIFTWSKHLQGYDKVGMTVIRATVIIKEIFSDYSTEELKLRVV